MKKKIIKRVSYKIWFLKVCSQFNIFLANLKGAFNIQITNLNAFLSVHSQHSKQMQQQGHKHSIGKKIKSIMKQPTIPISQRGNRKQ